MQTLSNELRAYYRSVADALPCAGHAKRRYLKELRNRLCDLQAEQPGADRKAACERFGTAEEIAESWMENISASEYKRWMTFNKRAKRRIAGSAALVGVGMVLLGGFYFRNRDNMQKDFVIKESVIVYLDGTSGGNMLLAIAESKNITIEEAVIWDAYQKDVTSAEYLQTLAEQEGMTLEELAEKYDLDLEKCGL